MNKPVIRLVVEDELHQNVLIRILKHFDDKFEIGDVYGFRGNSYIKKKLHAFNEASQLSPYLVLTDLDNYACPPTLIGEWVNFTISHNMIFRIAVKEAESW
ncbi:MAG TPA: hypothetical protein PLN79_13160, partial [bacterium]|nr:hypothetical protein [bacterium]